MSAFEGKADVATYFSINVPWCPKGQFISRRVDVKIGRIEEHGG